VKITKVRFKKNKVTIKWQNEDEQGRTTEFMISSYDDPVQAFKEAWDNLVTVALGICDMEESYRPGMKATGVSFSSVGEDEVMGAVVTIEKSVSSADSPLIINTPHLASRPTDPNGQGPCLCLEHIEILEEVMGQAEEYVQGIRSQLELPLGEE
jgi:hypothetical protein